MPSLLLPNATLDYEVSVSPVDPVASFVVQLHGLTSSRSRDARLGLDLAERVNTHPVLRYDARGHGRSTGDDDERSYRWSRLADDLIALLDVAAPGRVHGVGQSMGAGTLLHAAVCAPERFASLVLGIPPTAWDTRAAQRESYLDSARVVERDGIETLVSQSHQSPSPPAVDSNRPLTRPEVQERLLPTVFRGAAGSDLPDAARIATLGMPTLLLAWTDDPAHPLSTAQRLHELMPASTLVTARTPADTAQWSARVAEHLGAPTGR
ncbi:MAG: alpha/beta hydrolase [Ornithinimicrobium sp.]